MCIGPYTKKINGELYTFPCGHCYECVRKRKREWQIRIMSEMSSSDCAFFSLISYNQECIPDPMLPDKRALQSLVKRLRKFLSDSYGATLKYFIVSEYGEMRNRLHYHAIFFIYGVLLDRFQWKVLLEEKWGKGFCSAFSLNQQFASYACKYMQKSYNMMMHSRLGYDSYAEANGSVFPADFDSHTLPDFPIKGRSFPLPRGWYDKQLFYDQVDGHSFYNTEYVRSVKRYWVDNPRPRRLSDHYIRLQNEKHYSDNPDLLIVPDYSFVNSPVEPNEDFYNV